MSKQKVWNEKNDQLLRYLYEHMSIYQWTDIAKKINEGSQSEFTGQECRKRYLVIVGPIVKDEWTPEEEKELYRLHNQNGNRWAVIAQNLIGRTDNSVKNHFYSKLRKSLRTLNKIAKLHLKKIVKEVGGQVLYKLTQATDQSLKQNTDLSKSIIELVYDLKNRLLEYDMDQKYLKNNLDYSAEKQLLTDLSNFNKIYKKKTKKNNESVKKGGANRRNKHYEEDQICYDSSESEENSVLKEETKNKTEFIKKQVNNQPKKTLNFLIKEPSKQDQLKFELQAERKPQNSNIEDILREQGVLENGNYGLNLFRRDQSSRSFSVCSQASVDLLAQSQEFYGNDFMMKECSEVQNESQIFKNNQ